MIWFPSYKYIKFGSNSKCKWKYIFIYYFIYIVPALQGSSLWQGGVHGYIYKCSYQNNKSLQYIHGQHKKKIGDKAIMII